MNPISAPLPPTTNHRTFTGLINEGWVIVNALNSTDIIATFRAKQVESVGYINAKKETVISFKNNSRENLAIPGGNYVGDILDAIRDATPD